MVDQDESVRVMSQSGADIRARIYLHSKEYCLHNITYIR